IVQFHSIVGRLFGQAPGAWVALILGDDGIAQLLAPRVEGLPADQPAVMYQHTGGKRAGDRYAHGSNRRLLYGTTTLNLDTEVILCGDPGEYLGALSGRTTATQLRRLHIDHGGATGNEPLAGAAQ